MRKMFYFMMLVALVCSFPSCVTDNSDDKKDKTATVTFWTDDADCVENIEVNLWKYDDTYDQYRLITNYYTSAPACGAEGCANFYNVEYGDYYFWAENSYYEWEGDMRIDASCEKMQLYVDRARVRNKVPSDAPKMEPAVMEFDMNSIVNN